MLESLQLVLVAAFVFGGVCSSSSVPSSPSSSTHHGAFASDVVARFIQNRCDSRGNTEDCPTIWSYEGTLTDPLTGKVIADVEGLELVKSLPTISRSSTDDNSQSLLGNLSVKRLLFPKNNQHSPTPQWDSATTILSRRLFCYRRPSSTVTKTQPYKSLLTSLRLRPDGPLRHLSPSENIAVYDSAITFISRNEGREMVVFSEHGGNEEHADGDASDTIYVMGNAQVRIPIKEQSTTGFDFAIHAQKGTITRGRIGPILPPLRISSNDEVVISPPRSRFLQFGKGDGNSGSAQERKYGSVHETYSYSFGDDSSEPTALSHSNSWIHKWIQPKDDTTIPDAQTTVRYTRFGEAPPWYAPGRMCTLELKGHRIELSSTSIKALPPSSGDLPPLALWATSKCMPSFWSGWPSTPRVDNSLMRQYYQLPAETGGIDSDAIETSRNVVQSFCGEGQRTIESFEDVLDVGDQSRWLKRVDDALAKMQATTKRLSKSFVVSELPRT